MADSSVVPLGITPDYPFQSEASWFCCGTAWGPCGSAGHGACGTCNSGSLQCAWPNISSSCVSVTNPGACGDSMAQLACGHTLYVTSLCNSKQVTVHIADCGPNVQMFCGEQTCCNGHCAHDRLIDLTPAAFSSIASLSSGLTAVSVSS